MNAPKSNGPISIIAKTNTPKPITPASSGMPDMAPTNAVAAVQSAPAGISAAANAFLTPPAFFPPTTPAKNDPITGSQISPSVRRTIQKRPDPILPFVPCGITNDNHAYPAALERWKLYQVLPDPHALQRSLVRIIDESGEDHLYPASLFAPIPVPKAIRAAMASDRDLIPPPHA